MSDSASETVDRIQLLIAEMLARPFISLKLLVIFSVMNGGGWSEEMEIYSLFGRRASIYFPYLVVGPVPSMGVNTQADYANTPARAPK